MQEEAERVGKRDLVATDEPTAAVKSVHHTASKINGVAPKRKPRIGAEYQAVIPPVPPQKKEEGQQH